MGFPFGDISNALAVAFFETGREPCQFLGCRRQVSLDT